MKRILILAAAALVLGSSVFADGTFASLVPKTAKSMGLGGVFSSVPTAEFSFFGNPASFAAQKGTLILPSIDTWLYIRPTSTNISTFTGGIGDATSPEGAIGLANKLMSDNGGTGLGLSTGFGFAGRGLGLGAFITEDTFIQQSGTLASALLHTDAEATTVIGLGFPLQLGDLRLSIGGDLRPFYRVSLHPTLLTKIAADVKNGSNPADTIMTDAFFGMAMDLGATLQLASLTLGLSIRDIAPPFSLWQGTLTALGNDPAVGTNTSGITDPPKAVYKPNVTMGLSWSPKLIPGIIDPSAYFEVQDPVTVFAKSSDPRTMLNLFHAGAEVRLLSLVTLRGGINRGWLSAGAGIKLLFIDVNASVFTEELGPLPGDQPRSGLSVQAAIRF